jgi:hypothetical protein
VNHAIYKVIRQMRGGAKTYGVHAIVTPDV